MRKEHEEEHRKQGTAVDPEGAVCRHAWNPQWTGIITQIAIDMLEAGKVDAVVCVQSDPNDKFTPMPVVARTVEVSAHETLHGPMRREIGPCNSRSDA